MPAWLGSGSVGQDRIRNSTWYGVICSIWDRSPMGTDDASGRFAMFRIIPVNNQAFSQETKHRNIRNILPVSLGELLCCLDHGAALNE